jgi:tol-pal system protein YbgF
MRTLALLTALLSGCAQLQLEGDVKDLRARLDKSERARADLQSKVDELDNKIFLLTDQVESQKVASARRGNPLDGAPPSLPVVTLRPEEGGDVEDPPVADPEPPPRPPVAARRALKLEGRPRPSETPLPAPGEGNLGVVKLPDKGVPVAKGSESAAPSVEPLTLYREAYAKLMAGKNEEAATELRDFVHRFPRHDYADNAQYWLGESYYARHDYRAAAPEFKAVVARWPSGNKAPDALLKLAYCTLADGSPAEGRQMLQRVVEHYPRTDAAGLAQRRLKELAAPEVHP